LHLFGWAVLPSDMDICQKLWRFNILCNHSWYSLRNVSLPLLQYYYHKSKSAHRFWATVGPIGAEVVGLQVLPSALSITWLILVLPCTFSEPIGLELRTMSGDIYLHAQIFTGLMYIGAAVCMWFLRAWKIGEIERLATSKEKREEEIRDDDVAPRDGPNLSRRVSKASVKSKVKAARGLWSWQRV